MICPTCGFENAANAAQCASCATPLPANIQTGHTQSDDSTPATYSPLLPKGTRLQNGLYAVSEMLGQGGFGITYKGGDLSLRRYVAVKEFFPQGCARQGATVHPAGTLSEADYAGVKAKFVEEARTLARFSDPGIVRVFGVFEENNTAYMVMEFLEGQTLSARIREKGMVEEAEVVAIAEKVGSALRVVHEANLLHRDIKPDNICLTKDGRVVLIDFGTARAFASGKTVKHTTMLTAGYAPLEQYGQQARFGPFTDIYALAATLYHALTGQIPSPAPDRMSGVDLKAPHLLNPRVSMGVSGALMRALNVKTTDRPQNIAEFVRELTAKTPLPAAPTNFPATPPPQVSPGGWGAPAPQTAVIAPQPTIEENWFHSIGGRETGPMARATIQSLVRSGVIKPDTMIWREGMTDWIPAGQSEWGSQLGASSYAEPNPVNRPRETDFDRLMMSVPAWAWRTLWISVFLLLAGRITLGVVRYQNGGRDFGERLAAQVMESPEAIRLREAELTLGEGVLDEATLTKKYNHYAGKVRYQDGDAGDLSLDVTSRNWLYAPEKFAFEFTPTDFSSVMRDEIRSDLNDKIRPLVTSVRIRRVTRTQYSGGFTIRGYDARDRISDDIRGGSIEVTVTGFNADGAPATWSYSAE